MANQTGPGSPRKMRLAWLNCATTCTVNDYAPTSGIIGTLTYDDQVRKNHRLLCQNVGGSGGYFTCGWF